MSAGSFDSSSSDGVKRRIAHAGAGSSDLLRSLNYKRESMGKLLSGTQKPAAQNQKKDIFPIFLKRQRVNSDSENEKLKEKKLKSHLTTQTFCGRNFMSAVTSQKNGSKPVIHSDSDGSDPGWMSKSKVMNEGAGKFIPKQTSVKPQAKRRAIMSSDEEEWAKADPEEEESEIEDTPKKKSSKSRKGTSKSSHKKSNNGFIITKKKNQRKHNFSTGSEELDDGTGSEEEEIADTPSSSELSDEDNELNPKKSLKELTQKARRVRERKRRRGEAIADLSDASEGDEDGDVARGSDDDDFDSEDSDAGERRDHRANRQRQILEERCVEFINSASVSEMTQTEKFNERFAKALVEKRPFRNFAHIREECGSIGRAIPMLESYIEFLENRSILDQVLDDCKKQSEDIKVELEKLQSGETLMNKQPAMLNPDCVLHPYQQVGLQWLIMMNKLGLNAILADEMGLGKTIQIIAFLAWTKEQPKMQFPHLIVVPSSTLENWMNEIAKWCPSLRLLTYYGSIQDRAQLRHRASSRNVDVILTTYNMIISRPEDRSFFKKFHINYVIYDEGHMLRSCNTMRYKNLMRVQGKRKILLTGTPLQNNLVELISLLFFTMTKMFTKYCDDISMLLQMFARKGAALNSGKRGTEKKKPAGKRVRKADDEEDEELPAEEEEDNLEDRPMYEQHKIAQAKSILHPFVLRRLKTNVLSCLPKKHENVMMCDITDTQDELYTEILRDYQESKILGNGNAMGAMMQMRQVANHPLLYRRIFDNSKVGELARALCSKEPKYRGKNSEYVAEDLSYMTDIQIHTLCQKFSAIRSYGLDPELALDSGKCKQLDLLLPKIFEKGEKVLIFSQFTTLLDILELYMECHDYKYCRLDGTTPVLERQDLINQFSEDPSIRVFLLSTKAGGLGINLTAANNIIIHDIDLNPYNDKQAEDRCHRMGQTREVYVTRLIAQSTIEESMLELAQKKLELERHITSGHGKNDKEDLDANTVDELLSRAIDRRRE